MLHQSFDIELIAASVLIAALASYAALAFSRRVGAITGLSGIDPRAKRAEHDDAGATVRYRQIAEALSEIVWTATTGGQIDFCNRAWFAYSGLPAQDIDGLGWGQAIHPNEIQGVLARWKIAVATGDNYEMEYRIRRFDGEYRWHLGRATALRDNQGRIEKWLGTATDIHEQKRAEGALRDGQRVLEDRIADREAEAQAATNLYRLLAENATDMVSTHRVDGSFDYATPSWSEFTGVPNDTLRGQFPALFSHPDDYTVLLANYRLAFTVDELVTTAWRCRRADRSYGWLETTTRTVREPETRRVMAFVSATRDVTERRKAEAAIRQSEARYRQLLEHAADAILIADGAGHCTGANARACSLLRQSEEKLIGVPLRSLFIAREEETAARLSALAVGDVILAEDVAVRGDDTHVPVELSIGTLPEGGLQVIARDITNRKELERLKNEFISIVSHELRTPLTSIRGALGLLASGRLTDTPATSARMLDLAVSNTDRLIRLINDILDVERIDSGAVGVERSWCNATDIASQVIDAMRPVAERAGVELKASWSTTLAWADSDRLTQTLTNLVGNAIKFSPAGSTVEINVSSDTRDVRFEVRDRGRGIPSDKLDSIFERFHQVDASDSRAKGGTGLGLSICRSIVRQHGGKIWVESTLGHGSTFCVTLPLPPAPRHELATPTRERVIVCDDDPGFLEVMTAMLEHFGYAVSTATSGLQAIELVKVARPHVVFIDMVMRGLSGRETIEALQSDDCTRGVPIIVMSGAMPQQDPKRVGAIDWLAKPVEETALLRALSLVSNPIRHETGRVLVVEDDRALSQVIAATLESRGYTVNVTHNGADALACHFAVGADIIVTDLCLPDMSGLDVLEWIRAETDPAGLPAIVYTAADLDIMMRDRVEDAGALIAIKGRTSPDALVDLVTRLLNAESRLEALSV
ncbi:MAG: PAS domain S-box protein [Gemmatimonadaceae bacterium]